MKPLRAHILLSLLLLALPARAATPLQDAIAAADWNRAALELAQLKAQATDGAGEAALHQSLRRLLEAQPGEPLRAQVRALVDFEPITLTDPPDPDHARGRRVAAYPVAATARAALRIWAERDTAPHKADRLAALGDAVSQLPAAQAMNELRTAAQDPELASAAVLRMAALSARHEPARQFLLAGMDDARLGPSCAQALAADEGAQNLAWLGAALTQGSVLRQRHALLSLSLMQSRAAQARLREFAADTRHDAALRDQVRAWLR